MFVHQALTWGFLITLVPLLIHLINMMRHKRVKWAAMDFLLQSYKRQKQWIWLRQLILMLLRMAAVALAVAMLAQWITRGQWLDIFSGKTTHHYVVLDDSLSMSQRIGGTTAFDKAIRVIHRIGTEAAEQDSRQKFTLLRYSQAALASDPRGDSAVVNQLADLNSEVVDTNFDILIEEKRNQMDVTELSAGPRPALEVLQQLIGQNLDENQVVYLLSDFRAHQWQNPTEMKSMLREIEQAGADLQLVDCSSESGQNLAIVDLAPANETRAAGVPLFINVKVKNFGTVSQKNVQLSVQQVFHDPAAINSGTADELQGETDEIHIPPIENIEPGEVITTRVQVYFPKAGEHVVRARLADGDAVSVDNRRSDVISLPDGETVLIVDGSDQSLSAFYLATAFRPGPRANTGIRPEVKQTTAYLRDASLEELQKFTCIYLLDVDRLPDRAVANLENYVQAGGGLAIFFGDRINYNFYNTKLYAAGQGLLPMPIAGDGRLRSDEDVNAPDIQAEGHPVFATFAAERNPLIRRVSVNQYVRVKDDWLPDPQAGVQIAARLRNQAPLAIERRFGSGRVMAFLTTLSPLWNNWAQDPSFVVVVLKLQSYLAAQQRTVQQHLVAAPINVSLEADKYQSQVKFMVPAGSGVAREEIILQAAKPASDAAFATVSIGNPATGSSAGQTARSGIYEALLRQNEGKLQVRRFAVNTDSRESDLSHADPQQMLTTLDPLKPTYRLADEFEGQVIQQAGFNRSMLMMVLLIGMLLAEQLLSYFCSYHPQQNLAGPR